MLPPPTVGRSVAGGVAAHIPSRTERKVVPGGTSRLRRLALRYLASVVRNAGVGVASRPSALRRRLGRARSAATTAAEERPPSLRLSLRSRNNKARTERCARLSGACRALPVRSVPLFVCALLKENAENAVRRGVRHRRRLLLLLLVVVFRSVRRSSR